MLLFFAQGSALVGSPTPPTTGLKLWLKADAGVSKTGSNVTAWADQSGNGNNTTTVASPQFNASSINGLPGITLAVNTFGTQTITGTATLLADDSPRTVVVVMRKNTDGGGVQNGILAFRKSTPGVAVYAGTASPQTIITGSSHPYNSTFVPSANTNYVFQWNVASTTSGNPTFLVNHVSTAITGTSPLGSEAGGAAGFYVGSTRSDGLGTGLYADLCEVLVWDHVLTAPQQTTCDSYLLGRYGL